MMMWLPSILLLVAFSGVLVQGEDNPFRECGKRLEELDLEELERKSGDEQMEIVCPEILEAFRCVDGQLPFPLEEISDILGVDNDIGKLLRVAINTKSMLTDLCTEGTQLNEDVKADMQCFESIDENEAAEKCKAKASVHEVFTDISNELEEMDSEFDPDAACQQGAFMAACVSFLVHETCGQRAFNTFNTILKRTTIFQHMICTKEKLEELKTTLIDRLDMSEAEKDIFKLGLDLKRRRK